MSRGSDPGDGELRVRASRSRKVFRWMPSAVLSHNLPMVREDASALGRNLYGRKLRESSDPPPRRAFLRWQAPRAYLILFQRAGWLWTWHAPWCRRCDCPGAGWRFALEPGYWSGLGFELSFPSRHL